MLAFMVIGQHLVSPARELGKRTLQTQKTLFDSLKPVGGRVCASGPQTSTSALL